MSSRWQKGSGAAGLLLIGADGAHPFTVGYNSYIL